MKVGDIKIGMKLRIVGDKGCCSHNKNAKCKDCDDFKQGIEVISFNNDSRGQVVNGSSLIEDNKRCHFHPDDLEQFEIKEWRNEI